ncbi:MAG: PilZ domain-containing protein [Planctomycetes bacterium]|nr:PilZ domain-containing protein [Planctomycetota bacterium]
MPRTPRSRRLPVDHVFATLREQGLEASPESFGIVRNVSHTGLAIETPSPPRLCRRVDLQVSVGEELFDLTTIVRRVQPLGGGRHLVGLELGGAPAERTPFLRAILAARSAPAAPWRTRGRP